MRGSEEANGGHCRVAWSQVCRPTEFGGLGINNLSFLNHVLRARWCWMQQLTQRRAWSSLQLTIPKEVLGLFFATTECTVGNGRLTKIWHDRWLAIEIAPKLFAFGQGSRC